MRMLWLLLAVVCCACSVKYDEQRRNVEDEVSELLFEGAAIERVEGGDLKVALQADVIEQYKGGVRSYGRGVKFTTMNGGKSEASGQCKYIKSDTENKEYLLFGDIELHNNNRGMDIKAASLKWDGKSEQLMGGESDTIEIRRGGTVVYGSAFSASGVSNTFAFGGAVSGEVETEDSGE